MGYLRGAERTVRDVMTSDVISIHPDQTVTELIGQLADTHVSGLPVIDSRRRLLGVVSTTDLLSAFAEAGDGEARERLMQQTARDIMTPRGLVVEPDLELREAALQMEYGGVRRLFVEYEGQVVGVISRSDINRVYALGLLN
ncbi:MAG: CBS domain-containing protein [Gemmatimonadales bacterium]|nr:CBS domain-containing protein [Gemmatimonadales bacterium]